MPNTTVANLIESAESLDTEIASMEVLATQASTFVSDTSYLLGGDLTETRDSLQKFLSAIQDYAEKVALWRRQTTDILENTPKWIDQASIVLTVFLVWFAVSQFSLLLHGIAMQRGVDPLVAIRRERHHNPLIKDERDLELEE